MILEVCYYNVCEHLNVLAAACYSGMSPYSKWLIASSGVDLQQKDASHYWNKRWLR